MFDNPKFAPARPDLTFLRRRVRPKQQPPPPAQATRPAPPAATSRAAPPAASTPAGSKIDYHRPDREAPAPPPAPSPPTAPPTAPTPTPAPAASSSLDLSGDSTPTIDYSRHGSGSSPASPPAPASSAPASSSLDLSTPSAAAAPSSAPRRVTPKLPEPLPAWMQRHVTRISGNRQQIMSVQDPTVTLTRVQSGIGQLVAEAMCSPEIGDLRLGAVFQLRSGGSGVVQQADGSRFGPSSRRPMIVGSREEYERIGIDLRQMFDVERIAIYAYSQSRVDLAWGGTLVVTLDGGARLELPLEKLYPGPIAMLLTLYNMHGELVVRAEMENIAGDVREAARAYGFDRITWRDAKTPVD